MAKSDLLTETTAGGPPIKGHQPVPEYGLHITPSIMGYQPMNTNLPIAPDVGVEKAFARFSHGFDELLLRIRNDQDEARVTQAITDLRRHATDLEAGEGGWRTKLGEDALLPDNEGKSLVERVDQNLQEYGNTLKENMNDRQRKLFDRNAANVYQSSYAGVSHHMMQQGQEHVMNVAQKTIEEEINIGSVYAYKPDKTKECEDIINKQVDLIADKRGLSPEEKNNLRRNALTPLYKNQIVSLLVARDRKQRNPALALGILKANSQKMNAQDVLQLRRMIDASFDRVRSSAIAGQLGTNPKELLRLANAGEGNGEDKENTQDGEQDGEKPDITDTGTDALVSDMYNESISGSPSGPKK